MRKHLLVINTHNRIREFRILLSHIVSFDNRFCAVIIICDSEINYYDKVKNIVNGFTAGCNKYKIIHLNNVGGALARSYVFLNKIYSEYDFLSFCDDDDLPFEIKFIDAEKKLTADKNALGYSSSYIRHYGNLFSKKIVSQNCKIGFKEICLNNDIGGFSFVTINCKFLYDDLIIPSYLKSNQDWYLWIRLLFENKNRHFIKTDIIGLVYNDSRKLNRLTTSYNNLLSTYLFHKVLNDQMSLNLESVKGYFYIKYLKLKNPYFVLKVLINNYNILGLNSRHVFSYIKLRLYNEYKRLFLSKA